MTGTVGVGHTRVFFFPMMGLGGRGRWQRDLLHQCSMPRTEWWRVSKWMAKGGLALLSEKLLEAVETKVKWAMS